jgi:glycosyltransferase involved in cell wall biosynthesis
MEISVGVCAHNEEENIGGCLNSILNQTAINEIKEIIVVSSSRDNTNSIVKKFSSENSKIKLITQKERTGKAKAVNLFIKNSTTSVLVLHNADLISCKNAVFELIQPFKNKDVGMVGGHPIPVNTEDDFIGFTVNLIWRLHHRISRHQPKTGELVAFKKIFTHIPDNVIVDEAWIESIIQEKDHKIVYAPKAIVYNKGPQTLRDLINQRKRIAIGHLHLKKIRGYKPSTSIYQKVIEGVVEELNAIPHNTFKIIASILLEPYIRISAAIDFFILKKTPYIWDMPKTSKKVEIPKNTKFFKQPNPSNKTN